MSKSTWAYISNKRCLERGFFKSYARKSKVQREKKEVRVVMSDLDAKVEEILGSIKDDSYEVGKYRHFWICERNKKRHLSVLPYVDRGTQNTLKDATEPIIVNQLLDEQTAGIPGRGISSRNPTYDTICQMRKAYTDRRLKWCIPLDIHHCYDSINNVVVMRLLERCVNDKRTLSLLRKDLFAQKRLAIGDPISHLYCNLVIAQIIRYLKEVSKCPKVVCFADNICVFAETKEDLKRYAKDAKLAAARQRLRFNKAYPFEIDKAECLVWCGRKYYRNGKVLLRQDTKKRYISARHKPRSLPSYQGILQSCNCRHLKKVIEDMDNHVMRKQRTPFAGKAMKTDNLIGIKHTIVKTERRQSKQKDSEYYYDVQAIAVGLGLIRYTTSSKLLVQALSAQEIPIRDVVILKDWRGLYYEGSIYSNEEEADIIRKEFGIDY